MKILGGYYLLKNTNHSGQQKGLCLIKCTIVLACAFSRAYCTELVYVLALTCSRTCLVWSLSSSLVSRTDGWLPCPPSAAFDKEEDWLESCDHRLTDDAFTEARTFYLKILWEPLAILISCNKPTECKQAKLHGCYIVDKISINMKHITTKKSRSVCC